MSPFQGRSMAVTGCMSSAMQAYVTDRKQKMTGGRCWSVPPLSKQHLINETARNTVNWTRLLAITIVSQSLTMKSFRLILLSSFAQWQSLQSELLRNGSMCAPASKTEKKVPTNKNYHYLDRRTTESQRGHCYNCTSVGR